MIENYEHYISRNIKSVYKRKLAAPIVYIFLLVILWFALPVSDLFFPEKAENYSQIIELYTNSDKYIDIELTDLYFTGYTNTVLGQTNGYYYYTIKDGHCIFVLVTPFTSEEGLPHIESLHLQAKILHLGNSYQQLTESLAEDLSWTSSGMQSKVSTYILSEPDFHSLLSYLTIFLYFASLIYAFASIIIFILYICFPVLSPPCRQLGHFGKASELLAQAEEELATLPQLATEDMFITEHFFIEIADSGIAVIPIQEMIWIYKYSTLHKIFWYHFNISYTLHITTTKHMHIQCPKNIKSDIDGIIDYLSEANHDILVGFSEENRLKVQEMQNPKVNFERLIRFLKKRY